MYLNNKVVKTLSISSSAVHDNIKRFKVPKGQCRQSVVDASAIQPLKQHCIKNRQDSVILKITAWVQEHLLILLCFNTLQHHIHKCRLKLYHANNNPYVNMIQKPHLLLVTAHLKGTEANRKLFWGHINWNLKFFLQNMFTVSSWLKRRGIIWLFFSSKKSLHISVRQCETAYCCYENSVTS